MESMDRSDINSIGNPTWRPASARREKNLKSKTNEQRKLKDIKLSLPQSKIFTSCPQPQVIRVEPSQFRSVVQHLTGRQTRDIDGESDQALFEILNKSKAYEDMSYCVSFFKNLKCLVEISQECLDCLVYCSLFPKDYEIDHDTLSQLWMAEGLIKEEPMEGIATSYLRALCKNGECISLLSEDEGTGKIWYKVNSFEIPERVIKTSKISPIRLISEDPTSVLSVAETECVHLTLQRLLPKDFQALGRYSKIRTLLLLGKHKGNVKSIPYDFFMSLQYLRALDLSRTNVSELPSSIGNARGLRYLDLSETLIKRLPETIEFLRDLQTLKLQNCPRLVALPKSTKKLTRLRHLDLGTLRRITSMPAGMGALSYLRILLEFIVGKEHGCRITELKNMNDLGGKFCLSKLENVASPNEAKEANLDHKKQLKVLELRWTDDDDHQESIGVEYEVMKCLQPHTNLQDLRILCYGGSTFPTWISHPSFGKLTKITIFKCASCQVLPSLGQLPSLESLSLIELIGVGSIDFHFRRDMLIATDDNCQFVAFPALQKLEINSMLSLEKWSDIEKGDFPRLKKISIIKCPKLVDMCELINIGALEYVELNQCTMLTSLPYEELPASLETVVIENCPRFNFSFSKEGNKDWVKSQYSPNSAIYRREAEKGTKRREGHDPLQ